MVVSDEIEAVDLFSRRGFVIGVPSALPYTASQTGNKVSMYRIYHYLWHQDRVDYSEQLANVGELNGIVDDHRRRFGPLDPGPELFEAFNADRFARALGEVVAAGTST